jgi:hypothetical protein
MPWKKLLAWATGQIDEALRQKLEFVLEENRVYRALLDRVRPKNSAETRVENRGAGRLFAALPRGRTGSAPLRATAPAAHGSHNQRVMANWQVLPSGKPARVLVAEQSDAINA